MALPRKLKNLNCFNDGNNYLGVVQSFTPPKLSRKMEAYRAGGMDGSVNVDLGMDDGALDVQWTIGGLVDSMLKQYGANKADACLLRFTGALQRDDTGDVDALEIVIRGRHSEIDQGELKTGETSAVTIQTKCAYYKLSLNGQVIHEVDLLNMVCIVNGVDVLAKQRQALGV